MTGEILITKTVKLYNKMLKELKIIVKEGDKKQILEAIDFIIKMSKNNFRS